MRSRLFILLILPLAACTLGTHKEAATPAAPKPVAAPPAPPEELSIPQTAVLLPPKQEFNPDSIPKAPPPQPEPAPPEKTEATPPTRLRRATSGQQARPAAAPDTDVETPAAPPPVAAGEKVAPIQPILTPEEINRLKKSIEDRKREVAARERNAQGKLSDHSKSIQERIESFLKQCIEAEGRGDLSQADALAERAAFLARDLPE